MSKEIFVKQNNTDYFEQSKNSTHSDVDLFQTRLAVLISLVFFLLVAR